jgi:hypothetical protein
VKRPFQFDLDGVSFECEGGVSQLDISELMRAANVTVEDPRGAEAVADLFKAAMGPAVYERYKRHLREHATDPDTENDILRDMVEHYAERPTRRPTPSVAGPQNTPTGSPADSPSNGSRELTPEYVQSLRDAIAAAEQQRPIVLEG